MSCKTLKNRKHFSRKSRKIIGGNNSLTNSYGTVTFKKGTILYHSSYKEVCSIPKKPMIFLTLHPSEWYGATTKYVTSIELQRDINVLFMIKQIRYTRIFSALNAFTGNNLSKMKNENLEKYVPYLQKENLDGWFSTIENGPTVEVAVINTPGIFKIIDCSPIEYNWKNTNYDNNGEMIPKSWGTTYPITTLGLPVKMNLHQRFKPLIENYIEFISNEEPESTAFSVMLKNAEITYFDNSINNTIKWN